MNFKKTQDYLLPTYEFNFDGTVSWFYQEGMLRHSGVFYKNTQEYINVINLFNNGVITITDAIIEMKSEAKLFIDSERDFRDKDTIQFMGSNFQTDDRSIMAIMGTVVAGNITNWIDANNQYVPMSNEQLKQLFDAIMERKSTLFNLARQYKDHIDTLTSKTQIESYLSNLTWV
jgi:hypothetical protein